MLFLEEGNNEGTIDENGSYPISNYLKLILGALPSQVFVSSHDAKENKTKERSTK